MRSTVFAFALLPLLALAACGGGDGPAPLDTKNEACAWCRMAVSDARFAAQLTSPGREPRFFDDLGCLRDWRKASREPGPWTAWAADHRTREWARLADAVVARSATVQTPMGSGLLSWASAASRAADPDAQGAKDVPASELLGPAGGAK